MTLIEKVALAIEVASCPGREGPFGGYDYGHNTEFYGPEPEGGRYVIRDFRLPHSGGKWLHQTHDQSDHDATFQRMTDHHIAQAAIATVFDWLAEPSDAAEVAGRDSHWEFVAATVVWDAMLRQLRIEALGEQK